MVLDTLPAGVLVSFYGDDFTGSAAVMEVLTFAGLPTVLFLDTPTPAQLAEFSGFRAMGIAGTARAQDPAWMDRNLPGVFATLAALNAPIVHYKVCSTFDSSPEIGSIGRAIDIGARVLGGDWYPLVIAAPEIGRYQVFGNLFAVAGGTGYRLDRHPTMGRHPTTPMAEADVRRHLARQTEKTIGLVDFVALGGGTGEHVRAAEVAAGAQIIALDVVDDDSLARAGELIWRNRGTGLLAVGSQGIEYALVAHWRATGQLEASPPAPAVRAADRMIVVSGSCSPENAGQIAWAAEHGFQPVPIDALAALEPQTWAREIARVTEAALTAFGNGRDPLVHSATGPDDPSIAQYTAALAAHGAGRTEMAARLGTGLGQILDQLLRRTGVKRCVICGGDTSSFAAPQLGIYALTALAATVPGGSLAKAHTDNAVHRDLEIALKGGQMGTPDYLGQIKSGGGSKP